MENQQNYGWQMMFNYNWNQLYYPEFYSNYWPNANQSANGCQQSNYVPPSIGTTQSNSSSQANPIPIENFQSNPLPNGGYSQSEMNEYHHYYPPSVDTTQSNPSLVDSFLSNPRPNEAFLLNPIDTSQSNPSSVETIQSIPSPIANFQLDLSPIEPPQSIPSPASFYVPCFSQSLQLLEPPALQAPQKILPNKTPICAEFPKPIVERKSKIGRPQFCQPFRNHSETVPVKAHKCPFEKCECVECGRLNWKNFRNRLSYKKRVLGIEAKDYVPNKYCFKPSGERYCAKCRNHGPEVKMSEGHVSSCQFKSCDCFFCAKVDAKRLRTRLDRQKNRAKEKERQDKEWMMQMMKANESTSSTSG